MAQFEQLPVSLCLFVKDEEKDIRDCLESVLPLVSEIVVVDTGSRDGTIQICRKYTDRVYQIGFSDFGSIRTVTAHLAQYPWVLMLDADETILAEDWGKFPALIDQPEGVSGDDMEFGPDGEVVIDSWAFPRKRWADRWMTRQEEPEAYPDWQVRLFRNHQSRQKIRFIRRIHETISGCIRTEFCPDGPTIHHFQNVNTTPEQRMARCALYRKLYALDVAEGIEHLEPPVSEIDDENS